MTRATPYILGPALVPLLPAAAAAQEGGIFSVNLGLVIWTWVLFLLTLFVLAWKVFPFIAGTLEERQRKIQASIDEAHRSRAEAEQYREEQRQALDAARREAQALVERAREAAENLRQQLLEEARAEQRELVERTRRELRREREQLLEEVRREAVDVALAAAERLIEARLDTEENRRLVREYVGRVG